MSSENFLVSPELVILPEERQKDRFFVEQEKLRNQFPEFKLLAKNNAIAGSSGWLKSNLGTIYGIKIIIKKPYPSNMPYIETVGWTIQDGCPHMNNKTWPCVWNSNVWRKFYTMAFLVSKCALWINKYEVWKRTGEWIGVQDGGKSR